MIIPWAVWLGMVAGGLLLLPNTLVPPYMTLSSSALQWLLLLWTSCGGSTVSGSSCWLISWLCGALKGVDLCLYLDPSFADFLLSFLSCLCFFSPVLIFCLSPLSLFWLSNYLCSFCSLSVKITAWWALKWSLTGTVGVGFLHSMSPERQK